MSDWKSGTLREACDISTGYAFKGDQYEVSGNLRVVRGENVTVGALRWDSEKHWNDSIAGLDIDPARFINELFLIFGAY